MSYTPVFIPEADPLGINVLYGYVIGDGKNLYLVYQEAAAVKIIRSEDEGITWTAAVTIATAVDEIPLDRPVCIHGDTIHVFYIRDKNDPVLSPTIYHRRSTDKGATWGTENNLGTGQNANSFVRVSCATDGQYVHVGWVVEDSTTFISEKISIRRSVDAGASWETEVNPFPNAVSPSRPDIVIYQDYVHLIWGDYRDGTFQNSGEIYYAKSSNRGTSWGTEVNLSNTVDHKNLRPILAISKNIVYAIWQYPVNAEDIIISKSTNNGDTWSTPVVLYNGAQIQEHPFAEATPDGVIAICWTNGDTTPKSTSFMWSDDYGVTWTNQVQAYNPPTDSSAPIVTLTERFAVILDKPGAGANCKVLRTPIFSAEPSQDNLVDDFNRADEGPPPSADWTNGIQTAGGTDGAVVSSNQVCRAASGAFRQGSYYSKRKFGPDVDVVVEVSNWVDTTDNEVWVFCRLKTPGVGTSQGYVLVLARLTSETHFQLLRADGASQPNLKIVILASISSGDLFAITARYNLIILWRKPFGGVWTPLIADLQGLYPEAGYIGLEFTNNQETKITNIWATEKATPPIRQVASLERWR